MIERRELRRIQNDLKKNDETREKLLEFSRIVVRMCSWCIIQIHRAELEKALGTLRSAKKSLRQIGVFISRNPGLKNSGNIRLAEQEYTEARCLFDLVKKNKLSSLKEIGVESSSYLLGLLDLIGELRRLALNHLRFGRGIDAEKTLAVMENLYEDIQSLDHTGIIPTFRRKADIARRVIESTRGDVITDIRRLALEKAIKSLEEKASQNS